MKENVNWIYKVFLFFFFFAIVFSSGSSFVANYANSIILGIIIIIVIIIGIIFDMIGVAVLTSNESSLHAKASKKIRGAKEAIYLLKNTPKVSSICNDVVGDVCGIVSGSLGAVLTINIASYFNWNIVIVTTFITALISSLTVGGKAIFKTVATKKADNIVYNVGKTMSFFIKKT